jgi:RimJ/RimL family protein N-acetyltransferase
VSIPPPEYPRGPRVSLREYHLDDHTAWQRIAGDPRVAAHTPWPALAAPEAAAAWINESLRMAAVAPRRSFHLVVEQFGTDLVGCGTLDVLSIPHRQGEIGLYLRPDRWGEGLGTEVARLLLELAFTRLGLHRVQATADPNNIAAKRVLEHVNMRHEGTLLDRYLVDGQWGDRDMYAITLPEWRGLPLRRVATASVVPEAGIVNSEALVGGGIAARAAAPVAPVSPVAPVAPVTMPTDAPDLPVAPPQNPDGVPVPAATPMQVPSPAMHAAAPAPDRSVAPNAVSPNAGSQNPVSPNTAASNAVSPNSAPAGRFAPAEVPEAGLTRGHSAESLLIPGPRTQTTAPVSAPVPALAPAPTPNTDGVPPLEGVVTLAHELEEIEADQEIFGSL